MGLFGPSAVGPSRIAMHERLGYMHGLEEDWQPSPISWRFMGWWHSHCMDRMGIGSASDPNHKTFMVMLRTDARSGYENATSLSGWSCILGGDFFFPPKKKKKKKKK